MRLLSIARKALLALDSQHVFGKLEDRVRPDLQAQLQMMEPAPSVSVADKEQQHEDIKQALFNADPPAYSAKQTAWCYRHEQPCPIWGDDKMDSEDADQDLEDQPFDVNVTGFSCTDFSKRRSTTLPRFAGKTAPAFWKWLCEIKASRPHYAFWECSPFFPEEVIAEEMSDHYNQVTLVTGPTLMGWPVVRLRKFGCLIRKDSINFGEPEEFHRLFQKQCSLSGDVFFDYAPADHIVGHMVARAKSRLPSQCHFSDQARGPQG